MVTTSGIITNNNNTNQQQQYNNNNNDVNDVVLFGGDQQEQEGSYCSNRAGQHDNNVKNDDDDDEEEPPPKTHALTWRMNPNDSFSDWTIKIIVVNGGGSSSTSPCASSSTTTTIINNTSIRDVHDDDAEDVLTDERRSPCCMNGSDHSPSSSSSSSSTPSSRRGTATTTASTVIDRGGTGASTVRKLNTTTSIPNNTITTPSPIKSPASRGTQQLQPQRSADLAAGRTDGGGGGGGECTIPPVPAGGDEKKEEEEAEGCCVPKPPGSSAPLDEAGVVQYYHVHKSVLAVGSQYFQTLFRSDCHFVESTSRTSTIELNEIMANAIPTMLDYLYCPTSNNSLRLSTNNTVALHCLGQYFGIERLRWEAYKFCQEDINYNTNCHLYYKDACLLFDDKIRNLVCELFTNHIFDIRKDSNIMNVSDSYFWLSVLRGCCCNTSNNNNNINNKASSETTTTTTNTTTYMIDDYGSFHMSVLIAEFCSRNYDSIDFQTFQKLTDNIYIPSIDYQAALILIKLDCQYQQQLKTMTTTAKDEPSSPCSASSSPTSYSTPNGSSTSIGSSSQPQQLSSLQNRCVTSLAKSWNRLEFDSNSNDANIAEYLAQHQPHVLANLFLKCQMNARLSVSTTTSEKVSLIRQLDAIKHEYDVTKKNLNQTKCELATMKQELYQIRRDLAKERRKDSSSSSNDRGNNNNNGGNNNNNTAGDARDHHHRGYHRNHQYSKKSSSSSFSTSHNQQPPREILQQPSSLHHD